MPTIAEVRQKFPQYEDMSDEQLAGALHKKYYSDMPLEQFQAKIGLEPSANQRISGAFEAASSIPPVRLSADKGFMDNRPNAYGFGDYVAGSLPFGDEIGAAGGAIGQQLAQLTGRAKTSDTFGQSYDRIKALDKRYREEYETANPAKAVAGTGLAIATAGPQRGLQAAPTILGRMGQGATAGGSMGALYGAGEGDTLTDRGVNAAKGLGIGAATGAFLPPIIEGGAGLVSRALAPATSTLGNRLTPQNRATSIVEDALRRDNVTPAAAGARLQAQRQVNPNVVLADVAGTNTRGLTRAAVNTPGAARERITDFVMQRNLNQPDRIVDAVRNTLRNPADFGSTTARLAAERENIASPIYNTAMQTARPVNVSGVVSYIDQQVLPGVNQIANPLADLRPTGINATLTRLRGFFATPRNQRFDIRQLHQVKMELDDMVGTAQRSGDNNMARAVLGVQNRLLRAMDNASPDYRRARAIWAGTRQMEEALDVGRNVFRMNADEVRQTVQGMTAGEREMVQVGASRAIYDQVMGRRDGSNVVQTVFGTPRIRAALRAAFQDDQSFRRFQAVLMREAAMRRTADAVSGNSTTARQLADMLDTQSGSVGRDVFTQLIEGRPVQALFTAVRQAVFGERGINEQVANRIADMLLSRDPQQVAAALAQLQRRQGAIQRLAQRIGIGERALTTGITVPATGLAATQ